MYFSIYLFKFTYLSKLGQKLYMT